MFDATVAEAAHWSSIMKQSLRGVYVKESTDIPPAIIEEAEVLENQTVIDAGDRVLFYK